MEAGLGLRGTLEANSDYIARYVNSISSNGTTVVTYGAQVTGAVVESRLIPPGAAVEWAFRTGPSETVYAFVVNVPGWNDGSGGLEITKDGSPIGSASVSTDIQLAWWTA